MMIIRQIQAGNMDFRKLRKVSYFKFDLLYVLLSFQTSKLAFKNTSEDKVLSLP